MNSSPEVLPVINMERNMMVIFCVFLCFKFDVTAQIPPPFAPPYVPPSSPASSSSAFAPPYVPPSSPASSSLVPPAPPAPASPPLYPPFSPCPAPLPPPTSPATINLSAPLHPPSYPPGFPAPLTPPSTPPTTPLNSPFAPSVYDAPSSPSSAFMDYSYDQPDQPPSPPIPAPSPPHSPSVPPAPPGGLPCPNTTTALLNFKLSVDASSSILPFWNASYDACQYGGWPLLSIDVALGAVVNINLTDKGLAGPMPKEGTFFPYLRNLTGLDLSGNSLNGSLPSDLSMLTALTYIALRGNMLTGTLSHDLQVLTALQVFDLSSNAFNGTIPGSLLRSHSSGGWRNIKQLHLYDNQYSGVLPSAWGAATALTSLFMNNNQFQGQLPQDMSKLTSLQALNLEANAISGTLNPDWPLWWPQLTQLSFSNMGWYSSLPSEFGNWSSLVVLDLASNSLTGTLPPEWGDTNSTLGSAMAHLDLSNNYLSGDIPSSWSTIAHLECVSVAENTHLCGPIPSTWPCITVNGSSVGYDCLNPIVRLALMCDSSLAVAAGCSSDLLESFSQWDQDKSGMSALRAAIQEGTQPQPGSIASLILSSWDPSVQACSSDNCSACVVEDTVCGAGGALRPWIGNDNHTTSLETCNWMYIECMDGYVSGILLSFTLFNETGPQLLLSSLPPELGSLGTLNTVALNGHRVLSGTLPVEWSSLSPLSLLELDPIEGSHGMNGTIPAEWETFNSLQTFNLANAPFIEGSLPHTWDTSAMSFMRFNNLNLVDGNLPASWSNSISIKYLELEKLPGLYGPLPASWQHGTLESLKTLIIKDTGLHITNASLARMINGSLTSLTHLEVLNNTGSALGDYSQADYTNANRSGDYSNVGNGNTYDYVSSATHYDYSTAYDYGYGSSDGYGNAYTSTDYGSYYGGYSGYNYGAGYYNVNPFDTSVNPLLTFTLLFPLIDPNAYPGGKNALATDYAQILAGQAQVSPGNVVVVVSSVEVSTSPPPAPPAPPGPPRPYPRKVRHQPPQPPYPPPLPPPRPPHPSPKPPKSPPPVHAPRPPPKSSPPSPGLRHLRRLQSSPAASSAASLSTQVWFGADFASIPGSCGAASALLCFAFFVENEPSLLFTGLAGYPSFDPTGLQVKGLNTTLPEGVSIDCNPEYEQCPSLSSANLTGSYGLGYLYQNYDYAYVNAESVFAALENSKEPPSLILHGPDYVEVLEYSSYVDDGATAYDALDGFLEPSIAYQLCTLSKELQSMLEQGLQPYMSDYSYSSFSLSQLSCNKNVSSVVVNRPGNTSLAYLLTYTATNSRKINAMPVYRLVNIKARCSSSEHWCPNLATPACSQAGQCFSFSSIAVAAGGVITSLGSSDNFAAQGVTKSTSVTATVTKVLPRISLNGNGIIGTLSDGTSVMFDTVLQWALWTDPGATATGYPYGSQLNLTSLIQTSGAAMVDTSVPTNTKKQSYGFVVTYMVTDPVGNVALPAKRLITVTCPPPETFCILPGSNTSGCTTSGVCGVQLQPIGAAVSNALTNGAPPTPQPPTILLNGPSSVTILQGKGYDTCLPSATLSAVCDRGATASDAITGSLNNAIRVCGFATYVDPSMKNPPTLPTITVGCGINTSLPGIYSINFTVVNSQKLVATAVRTLVVQALCRSGEVLCQDMKTCSVDGVCVSNLNATTPSNQAVALMPIITLLPLPDPIGVGIVQIPRGGNYTWCNGTSPTAATPCEPGAIAIDPNLPDSAQNVTASVVVCPRASCLSGYGCSSQDLSTMTLSVSGLSGCGLNLLAAVGTNFTISFWVWSATQPPVPYSVNRTVVISEPCPDKTAPTFCQSASRSFFCSPVPCAQAALFSAANTTIPKLLLTPANTSMVYIETGSPPPFSLAPCPSYITYNYSISTSTQYCGAVAADRDTKTGNITSDLTPYIQVFDTPDAYGSGNTCNLGQIVLGLCNPGSYNYTYLVKNGAGKTSTASRTVIVYSASRYTLSGVLAFSSLTSSTAAASVASNISLGATGGVGGSTPTNYSDAVKAVSKKLTTIGVLNTDIDLSNASVTSRNGSRNTTVFDVYVTASIWIYNPAFVHRYLLQSFVSNMSSLGISYSLSGSTGGIVSKTSTSKTSVTSRGLGEDEGSLGATQLHQVISYMLESPNLLSLDQAFLHSSGTLSEAVAAIQNHPHYESASVASGSAWDLSPKEKAVPSATTSDIFHKRQLLGTGSSSSIASALVAATNATSVTSTNVTTAPNSTAVLQASLKGMMNILLNSTSTLVSSVSSIASGINISISQSTTVEAAYSNKASQAYTAFFNAGVSDLKNISAQSNVILGLLALTQSALTSVVNGASAVGSLLSTGAASMSAAQTDSQIHAVLDIELAQGIDLVNTSCFKLDKSYTVSFAISSFSSKSASGRETAPRRHLQGRGGIGGSTGALSKQQTLILNDVTAWQGYYLEIVGERSAIQLNESVLPRTVGPAQVIGGLLLHTTRKVNTSSCKSRFSYLDYDCSGAATAPPSQTDSSFVTNFYARLFAGKNNSIYPYGVDPVFLQTSSLYNPEIFNNMPLFYNSSDDQQISVNGIPYGFHYLDMPGYDDGFPVLFENSLSQTRSAQLMQYLLDGSYLDASSDTMTAELLTYNPVLHVLGYAQATFQWRDDGSITGTVTLSGLPALDYLLPTDSAYATFQKVFVRELAPLWTLTLFFLGYAIIKMCRAIEELSRGYVPGERFSLRRGLRLLAYHAAIEKYDVLMAFIIFIGAVYYTLYMAKYASSFVAQANYKVYDGASVSSAHWLLTAREDPNGTNIDPNTLSKLNISTPSAPADPGRWILPKGSNDMNTYVSVMASTHVMLEYWTVYGIIQAVVILMLVIRLLLALTFQSRVAVITKTLAIAFPELVHLVVIIVTVTSMWAMLAHVVFGWREEYVSTYEDSLFWHFTAMIDLNKTNAIYLAATGINSIQVSMLENILIETCFIIYQLLDSRLLVNFFVTVLIAAFVQIRYSNKGRTSTAVKDLGEVVFPNLARWIREQVLLMGRNSGAHPDLMTVVKRPEAITRFARTSRVFPSSQSVLKEDVGAPLPGSTDIATSALPSKHLYVPSEAQGLAARLQQPSDRWLQQKLREDVLHGWHKQAPSERVYVVKVGDMYFDVEALHGALTPFAERHMQGSDVMPSTLTEPESKEGKINEMLKTMPKKGIPVSEAAVEIVESTETEKDLKAHEAMEACLHNESLSASSSDSQTEKPVVEKLRGGGDIEAGVGGEHGVAPYDSESSERYRDSAPEAHLRRRASVSSQQSFKHASFLFNKLSQGFRSFRQVLGDRSKGHEDASIEDDVALVKPVAKPIFSVLNLEADVRAMLVAQRLHVKLYTSIQIRPGVGRNKVERRPLEPHHVDPGDEHGMDFHKHSAKEKKSMPLKPVLGSLSTTYAHLREEVIAMERWSEAIHRSHNVTRCQLAQATDQIATYIAKRTGQPAALPLSLLVPQPVSASAHTEHVLNGQGPSMTDVTGACPKAIGTDTQGDIRGESTKAIESPGPSVCAEPSTSESAMASAGPTRSKASLEGVPDVCKSHSVKLQSSRDAAEIMIALPAIQMTLFSKGALLKSSKERATMLAVVQSEGRDEITP